jgi:hypothetical protein
MELFVLGTLLTVIGSLGLIILNAMKDELKTASESVKELNVKVAVVIERIEHHDERIKKLEERE